MIGRFSILRSLDVEKINENINIYECETGEVPYLFMNEETINALCNEIGDCFVTKESFESLSSQGMVGSFNGYKFYPNNDLEFGKVEIR